LFPIDPQPASISPTVNISIVFICAVPLQDSLTAQQLVGDQLTLTGYDFLIAVT